MKDTDKKIKRVPYNFAFYDRTGIKNFLEKQAQKGWMLEKLTSLFWVFKRMEPKNIHFAVTYFPKASFFDPNPSQELVRFREFCEHTGWKSIASNAEMQIYYNEEEEPTPIETEPAIEINNIHKAMKKWFLPNYIFVIIITLFQLVCHMTRFNIAPLENLSNTYFLMSLLCCIIVFLMLAVEFISYHKWRKKAIRLAEKEMFVETSGYTNFQIPADIMMCVGLTFLMASIVGENVVPAALGGVACIILGSIAIVSIAEIMKKRNVPKSVNRIIFILMIVFMCVLSITVMIVGASAILKSTKKKPTDTYEFNGITYKVYDDEIPLRIEDLVDTDYDKFSSECSTSSSIFSEYMKGVQKTRFDAEEFQQISYTVTKVKMPFMYEFCKKMQLKSAEEYHGVPGDGDEYWYELVKIDEKPWKADLAYQVYFGEAAIGHYIICYDNYIIEFKCEDDFVLSDEQKSIIVEKICK